MNVYGLLPHHNDGDVAMMTLQNNNCWLENNTSSGRQDRKETKKKTALRIDWTKRPEIVYVLSYIPKKQEQAINS